MPDNHLRMQTVEKRLVLIVDDEMINREILGAVLAEDYRVIFAENGQEALDKIREHAEELSLILLDLLMPVVSGMVVLRQLRQSKELAKIPVIVMTADHEAEVASLELGALDFISKPYPQQNVILARVRRIIELSEDRQIIRSTERDPLTGLYNREFFYNYASSFDQHHKNVPMDAIVLDINHFHMINERYGRAYADQILRDIGARLRKLVQNFGGIVCRREADTFMLYCPHQEDYREVLAFVSEALTDEENASNRIRLRMGVYSEVDKTLDVEQRFDRAKAAADTVRSNYTQNIGFYDDALHQSELFAEQLTEDFDSALREGQFKVFYQPKFDIRPHRPILASAEALIRWQHPKLGLVSPGVFIPLFEENGMIQKLDRYVWAEAARQIRAWKEQYGLSVPVSVNVSRVDMFDPGIVGTFERLLVDNQLAPEELMLEITESAYTDDEAFIISTVSALRDLGLRVEMDDFGTGYSSLGMISHLPIDALKLDMTFVRNAFSGQGDMRMIELILDIAAYLGVPVIAEGVETRDQVDALRKMGCDLVQGYYFSKPVPPDAFAAFIESKKGMLAQAGDVPADMKAAVLATEKDAQRENLTFTRIALALSQDYFTVYYINTKTRAYVEYNMEGEDHRLFPVAGGHDFFEDCARQIPDRIIQADRSRVMAAFDEKNLLRAVRDSKGFSINYQVLVGNKPMHVNVKAIRLKEDNDHILIGMSNIEAQVQREKAYQEALEKSVTYASLAQALAADYFSIYYVDTRTDRFSEFTAHNAYEDLGIEKEGEDFFNLSRKNILRVMYPEDQRQFLDVFTKENVLRKIRENGAFTITYRLLFNGVPNYVSLKATAMGDRDSGHIVVGVNNIHAEMQRKLETVTYASIAEALAADYFSIYYVDTETERFLEYSSHEEYETLNIEKGGDDFFTVSRRNIQRVMYPEDQKDFLEIFTKENLMRELDKNGTFTVSYRLVFDGVPTWVNMKATRMIDKNDPHIVIGVNNIDTQMKRQEEFEHARKQSLTYSRIVQALSKDYYSIYMVNTETDEFVEYSSSAAYQELQVEQSGVDFFEECRRNVIRLVHPDDLKKALVVWEKDKILAEIKDGRPFSVTYRLMFDANAVYINCKVIRMSGEDAKYIVIGISNVDAQMKREKEYAEDLRRAKNAALRDALTGVKSKLAFTQTEQDINEAIAESRQAPFAVAVCDVNGLKNVNDSMGHKAGDRFIKDACAIICNHFKHSPVFRVGGDEFVVILQGTDYQNRDDLMASFTAQNQSNWLQNGIVIACGMAEWRADEQARFEAVFEEADGIMYENKKQLKK